MKKLTNVLALNENDGILAAAGKGAIGGAIKSGLVCIAIGASLILADKMVKENASKNEEVGE